MSNIYIQEPPTHGKVLLQTSAGDIDIELWSREAPKACRNFIQLCMEGYYNGTKFHRLVKGFIVQGGDPTGTGTGGSSIWGKPFKDEFHSRLRFTHRGLVAMANAGKDDNGSQFFFTLGLTPELQNKHTIFGKVTGNTVYNMLKLEEGDVDEDERPLYPHKIIGAKILSNPFDDIVPRETIKKLKDKDKDKKKESGTKNYKLLSFGEEAEEEEEEVLVVNKKFSGKGKSSHDLTKDPKLSSELAIDPATLSKSRKRPHESEEHSSEEEESEEDDNDSDDSEHQKKNRLSKIQEKLKSKKSSDDKGKPKSRESGKKSHKDEEEDDGAYYLGKDEDIAKKKRLEDLKKEYKDLKTSMKKSAEENVAIEEAKKKERDLSSTNNTMIQEFLHNQKEYKEKTATAKKKGSDREEMTMQLLKKFQKKLEVLKETEPEAPSSSKKLDEAKSKEVPEEEEEDNTDTWLTKTLDYEGDELVLAKDANMKTADWYALDDPRNPVVQRRREEAKRAAKKGMNSRRDLI